MATNEEIDAAWRAFHKGMPFPEECDYLSFKAGYLAGRKLPEVRAEEIQVGECYLAFSDIVSGGEPVKCTWKTEGYPFFAVIGCEVGCGPKSFTKFIGPLPLEDWGA